MYVYLEPKWLFWEGWPSKIEVIVVVGVFTYMYTYYRYPQYILLLSGRYRRFNYPHKSPNRQIVARWIMAKRGKEHVECCVVFRDGTNHQAEKLPSGRESTLLFWEINNPIVQRSFNYQVWADQSWCFASAHKKVMTLVNPRYWVRVSSLIEGSRSTLTWFLILVIESSW